MITRAFLALLPEPAEETQADVDLLEVGDPTPKDMRLLQGRLRELWEDGGKPDDRSKRDFEFTILLYKQGATDEQAQRLLQALSTKAQRVDYVERTLSKAKGTLLGEREALLSEIVAQVAQDPSAALSPDAVDAIRWLQRSDRVRWATLKRQLKSAGVDMAELKSAVKAEPTGAMPRPDDWVRYVCSEGKAVGWLYKPGAEWIYAPKGDIKDWLAGQGYAPAETLSEVAGRHWTIVNEPFEPEYLDGRLWNRKGAQLAVQSAPGDCPTWDEAFAHVGDGLNEAVADSEWCQANGIETGGDWLWLWAACVFQRPRERLPYLFLYSQDEQTGKSTFHESLSKLLARGYVDAEQALKTDFSGELEGAILCVIEEGHISRKAYPKLKKTITGNLIPVRPMYQPAFMVRNTTHWVHTANHVGYCPISPEDTRIVLVEVTPLKNRQPRQEFYAQIEREAPAALHKILSFNLPEPVDRLQIPVLVTDAKRQQMDAARSPLERLMAENEEWPWLTLREMKSRLPDGKYWTEARIRREMPLRKRTLWEVAQQLKTLAPWEGKASDLDGKPQAVGRALSQLGVEFRLVSGVKVWSYEKSS